VATAQPFTTAPRNPKAAADLPIPQTTIPGIAQPTVPIAQIVPMRSSSSKKIKSVTFVVIHIQTTRRRAFLAMASTSRSAREVKH
jgi:hypothetical protein